MPEQKGYNQLLQSTKINLCAERGSNEIKTVPSALMDSLDCELV
jgi:hypothetical protein